MLNIERINDRFECLGEAILRFRWAIIVLFLALTALSALGLTKLHADVDQDNWFLEDDKVLALKQQVEDIFPTEDFCAVLVTVDDVFTPEVLTAIRALGRELEEQVPFADEVLSITDLEFTEGTDDGLRVTDLVPSPVPTAPGELEQIRRRALAKPSLNNRIVSADSRESWIILRMKKLPNSSDYQGKQSPIMDVGNTVNRIAGQERYALLNPRTTGMPVVTADKQALFSRETPKLIGLSLLMTCLILAIFLRNLRGVLFPFLTAVSALVTVFGLLGHLGVSTDPAVIFVPIFLTLAVSIGYSIHVFNHFTRYFQGHGRRREALVKAVREAGWPLVFSALTTVAALLSFVLVPVRPIRWIGLTSAMLVSLTLLQVLVLLPVLLGFGKDRPPQSETADRALGKLKRLMTWLGVHAIQWPKMVILVLCLIAMGSGLGIARLEVSFDILKTYGLKIPYLQRVYAVAQSPVGSLYSYDLVLEFPQAGAAKDPEILRNFELLVREIEALPLSKKTTSLLQILKDMHQVMHEGRQDFHTLPADRDLVAQLLLLYENAGGNEVEKWVDYDYQRLRLMVEMGYYNSTEAKRELRWIKDRARELFPGAQVLLTGSIPQFTVMMDYVSWGQIKSFLLSLVIVSLLMTLVFGSLRTGLIGMIPNIAPALTVGGIMGWAGIPLDMMTITIMPMLLGLAVDDTIHFVNHSQLEFNRCGNYALSVQRTFTTIGVSLFMTTVVLTLTFAVYLTSIIRVFVSIGILVGAGLFAALLADYFVTPVLLRLTRPFGRESDAAGSQRQGKTYGICASFYSFLKTP